MHVLPPLVVATALALSGCATAAQGAIETPGSASSPTTSSTATASSPSGPTSTSPSTAFGAQSATPAPTTPPSPGTGGLLAADPVPDGPPLPPNPFELGGPAPVGSFVLGDSLSLSAGVGPVLARLGYPVLGVVGQSASETYLRTHLSSPTAQAAPAWVIELGTNNTADPADVARLAGWVAVVESLRSPDARQKVYWVTPHRPPSYVGSKSRWNLDAFNDELKRLDAEFGWLHVIDFDAVAKAHPEWFEQDTAMHLHPDSLGQGVLVALIAGPDAVPVEIPAPLLNGAPPSSAVPEPPTFVNPPRPRQTAPPTQAPSATPTALPLEPAPSPEAVPSAEPVPSAEAVPVASDAAAPTPG